MLSEKALFAVILVCNVSWTSVCEIDWVVSGRHTEEGSKVTWCTMDKHHSGLCDLHTYC